MEVHQSIIERAARRRHAQRLRTAGDISSISLPASSSSAPIRNTPTLSVIVCVSASRSSATREDDPRRSAEESMRDAHCSWKAACARSIGGRAAAGADPFLDPAAGATPEHDRLEQGVAAQPVGAVHAHVGALPGGEQAGNVGLAPGVGPDTAHAVVLGGLDGDRLARNQRRRSCARARGSAADVRRCGARRDASRRGARIRRRSRGPP